MSHLDLFWAVPFTLMGACIGMLSRWILLGITFVGRIVWVVVLMLALLGYPFGAFAVSLLKPPHTGRY